MRGRTSSVSERSKRIAAVRAVAEESSSIDEARLRLAASGVALPRWMYLAAAARKRGVYKRLERWLCWIPDLGDFGILVFYCCVFIAAASLLAVALLAPPDCLLAETAIKCGLAGFVLLFVYIVGSISLAACLKQLLKTPEVALLCSTGRNR